MSRVLAGPGADPPPAVGALSEVLPPSLPPPPIPHRLRMMHPLSGDEEIEAARRALESGQWNNGPEVEQFEREFAAYHGVDHAVALANGTVALAAIYLALGIGPGDEVIVPAMTFVSSATSVLHVGARPVFAEIEPETLTVDPASVESVLSPRTRAILAVHYAGQAAALDDLSEIAGRVGAHLIEDAAQAHGSRYRGRPVGGFGRAAMFSFAPNKNITMGEGGMVTTGDPRLAEEIRILRNHGQVSQYEYARLGFNWRMTEIHGAIGRSQLAKLDGIIATKRRNAAWMQRRLGGTPGLRLPAAAAGREHTFMLYTLLLRDQTLRDQLVHDLASVGAESKLYFPPVPRQPVFAGDASPCPATDAICRRMLSIPFNVRLTADDLETMAAAVERACRGAGAGGPAGN